MFAYVYIESSYWRMVVHKLDNSPVARHVCVAYEPESHRGLIETICICRIEIFLGQNAPFDNESHAYEHCLICYRIYRTLFAFDRHESLSCDTLNRVVKSAYHIADKVHEYAFL